MQHQEQQPYVVGKLRGGWAISFPDAETGRRRRYALRATGHPAAIAEAARFWKSRTIGHGDTVGALVEAWLLAHGHLAGHARNKNAWKAAKGYWENLAAGHITEAVCRAYAEHRSRAPATVVYEIELVRRACYWAHSNGVIPAKPSFWTPDLPDRVVRHLSKPQFRDFLAGCATPHVSLFAALAVATGGRATALLELRWDMVDLERRQVQLNRIGRVQSKKKRATVPMNDQLHGLLLDAKRGAITDYVIEHRGARLANIKKGVAAASRRSGVRCTPHMFRHSAAVWMAEASTPMAQIAQFLGHEDERTTFKIYARFTPDFLQGAAKALEW